jgi:hypothetical protein
MKARVDDVTGSSIDHVGGVVVVVAVCASGHQEEAYILGGRAGGVSRMLQGNRGGVAMRSTWLAMARLAGSVLAARAHGRAGHRQS